MRKPVPSEKMMWIVLGVMTVCVASVLCGMVGILGWYYGDDWWRPAAPLSSGTGLPDDDPPADPSVGGFAPDFTLRSIDGDQVTLSSYRGQPVLVNFWATWCEYCVEEMPMIQERFQRYAPHLVVLAVDQGESYFSVSLFIQQQGYTFPVLLDGRRRTGNSYYVDGYPMSFFIDRSGIIRYIVDGMMFEDDMEAGLSAIGVVQ